MKTVYLIAMGTARWPGLTDNLEAAKQPTMQTLSGTKIQPLDSEIKRHVPHTDHGVVGEDSDINQGRIDPLGGRGTVLLIISLSQVVFRSFPLITR